MPKLLSHIARTLLVVMLFTLAGPALAAEGLIGASTFRGGKVCSKRLPEFKGPMGKNYQAKSESSRPVAPPPATAYSCSATSVALLPHFSLPLPRLIRPLRTVPASTTTTFYRAPLLGTEPDPPRTLLYL